MSTDEIDRLSEIKYHRLFEGKFEPDPAQEIMRLKRQISILRSALHSIFARQPVAPYDCVYHYAEWASRTAREALVQVEQ